MAVRIERNELGVIIKIRLDWHRRIRPGGDTGVMSPYRQRALAGGAATSGSAVVERGRKLAEAVERVFADIYNASEATCSGADEAQSAK